MRTIQAVLAALLLLAATTLVGLAISCASLEGCAVEGWRSTRTWTLMLDEAGVAPAVRDAAAAWNAACGEEMFREVDSGASFYVFVFAGPDPEGEAGGFAYVSQGPIVIYAESMGRDGVFPGSMHEFGHVAGLAHYPRGLMNGDPYPFVRDDVYGATAPSPEDVAHLREHGWRCPR